MEALLATALFKPGDELAILDCIRACFGFEPDLQQWKHLYLGNPAGKPFIVLAWAGGTVVGQAALLPRWMQAFGRVGLAGHSIDAMTRPAWQRKGVSRALAAEVRQLAREQGFLATYGVSNEQSTHGILKYQERRAVRPFPIMLRVLKPAGAALALGRWLVQRGRNGRFASTPPDCAVAGPFGWTSPSGALEATAGWSAPAFDERHTRLFEEADAIPPIALVRNAAHLTWRYPQTGKALYFQRELSRDDTLLTSVTIRVVDLYGLRLVFVMEWFWRSTARAEGGALMREVVRFARTAGAHGVTALAAPATVQRQMLRRLGFVSVPEWLFPKPVVLSVRQEAAGEEEVGWFDASNWYLTWGDGFVL
jgi:GNAT superfamily N-acetyltransferase